MNKQLSTYERKMKNQKFKEAYEHYYKKLLFLELLMATMENDESSIRELAKAAKFLP